MTTYTAAAPKIIGKLRTQCFVRSMTLQRVLTNLIQQSKLYLMQHRNGVNCILLYNQFCLAPSKHFHNS